MPLNLIDKTPLMKISVFRKTKIVFDTLIRWHKFFFDFSQQCLVIFDFCQNYYCHYRKIQILLYLFGVNISEKFFMKITMYSIEFSAQNTFKLFIIKILKSYFRETQILQYFFLTKSE